MVVFDICGRFVVTFRFYPEYRLRVGNYRVLFEVEGSQIIIYRIRHRRDIYR